MASTRLICFRQPCRRLSGCGKRADRGQHPIRLCSDPILRTCRNWSRSLRAKSVAARTLEQLVCLLLVDLRLGLFDERENVAHAQNARDDAVGWKGSSASYFSPMPMNLMGCPVTWRMESAAPPRASPSILVRTTPVSVSFLWNSSAERTGPVRHGIGDEQNFLRIERRLSDCISSMSWSSMCRRRQYRR